MPMTDLLLVLLGTALANRLLLRRGPQPSARRALHDSAVVALASVFTLIVALGMAALLKHAVPALAWPSAALLLAIAPALLLSRQVLRQAMAGAAPAPLWLALFAGNASVIGLGLPGLDLVEGLAATLLQGLAAGIGFGLLMLLFTALDERLTATAVPAVLRGAPVLLLSAAGLALGLLLGMGGCGS